MTLKAEKFGLGQGGVAYLRSGWCVPESEFVWTSGHCSELHVPVDVPEGEIELDCWGYVPAGSENQHALIFANGKLVNFAIVREPTVLSIKFRTPDSGVNVISIYIPHAKRPSDAEGISDSRILGLAVSAIRVVSA